jgi:hypothetical protein
MNSVTLSVVMLSVILLSVIILSVIVLSAAASFFSNRQILELDMLAKPQNASLKYFFASGKKVEVP